MIKNFVYFGASAHFGASIPRISFHRIVFVTTDMEVKSDVMSDLLTAVPLAKEILNSKIK